MNSLKFNLKSSLLVLAILVGGCDSNDKSAAPTGQVVATVNGQEITLENLHAETGALDPALTAGSRKDAEKAALQQIIARMIVANYASENKLDKTPLAAMLRQRADQEALVMLVQRKLTADVPKIAPEEVELFIRDHPSSFAQRRIFVVDQTIVTDIPAGVAKSLEQLTTLAQVHRALAEAKIPFNQTVGTIDALAIDAEAAEKLASLPVGTMFISPEGNVTRVNLIRDVAVVPVSRESAQPLAREAIRVKRVATLAQTQLAGIINKGMSQVRYNAAYRPDNQSGSVPGPLPVKQ